MKITALSFLLLIFLYLLINPITTLIDKNTYIIGGEYILHKGEVLRGNLVLAFAQVTLEEDSRIEGTIHSFSSAIDLGCTLTGDITSVESDVKIENSTNLKSTPPDKGLLPFVVLLPNLARWNLTAGG